MPEQQLTQQEWDVAIETAQYSGRKYPGVDPGEVLSEIGEWIALNWHKVHAWRDQEHGMGMYKKSLRHAAIDACRRILTLEAGGDPDDAHRYSHAELRALLPYAVEDDWYLGRSDGLSDGPKGAVDPSKVNNWQESMLDTRDAFFSLKGDGQKLLRHGMAVAWNWGKLAVRLEVGTPEAARESVKRQLDKMRDFLGSSTVRIYGEYVGTRNNPDYDPEAHAEERGLLNDWMS